MPTELFADYYQWTVTSGATDAPAAGTSESITVSASTGAPTVTSGLTQFRIVDAADTNIPPEVMTVTAGPPGTTWTVTRGSEGGAPWAHAANWKAIPVVTANSLYQGLRPYNARISARGAFR